MLKTNDKGAVAPAAPSAAPSVAPSAAPSAAPPAAASAAWRGRLARARSLTWLGQTAASLCWISSMLITGVDSTGDWLQLCAASAWLLANIATLLTAEAD